MAIATTSVPPGDSGFMINFDSADVSASEIILAAGGAGTYIYLDQLWLNSAAAISLTVGAGIGGGAVTTPYVGPVLFAAGLTLHWDFRSSGGIKFPANTLLGIDGSGAGQISGFASGKIV